MRMKNRWKSWTVLSTSWQLRGGVQSTRTSAAAPSHRWHTICRRRFGGRKLSSFPQWINKATTSPTRLWPPCCRSWPRGRVNSRPPAGPSSPTVTGHIILLRRPGGIPARLRPWCQRQDPGPANQAALPLQGDGRVCVRGSVYSTARERQTDLYWRNSSPRGGPTPPPWYQEPHLLIKP
jgi:hypothetical protein